jgi:murein DD-endopeptidase MepM/ murein hydrolase activator NlpD
VYRFGWIFKGNKKARRRRLILSGLFLALLFFSLYFLFSRPTANLEQPETQILLTEGTIKGKSTLYQSLLEKNIPIRWIHLIISELKPYVDFNRIKGGTYRFFTDTKGELVKFIFEKSPLEVYKLEKGPQGYVAQRDEVSLGKHLVKVEGEIRSSLFEAMNAIGEQDKLTLSFAEILAWEIDFYQDLKKGDRFKVVVEKIYKGDQFIQYGTIYGLEYRSGERIIRGIFHQKDYYDETGNSLRRTFLKAPLQFNRISSRFSHARRHPILGGTHPHYGVDYAAPTGTPVWAVADGIVISMGWSPGFGKQVILRHANGYKTYYGHLSRYGTGIKVGKRVKQKEIIGYVGSTGLSTGPHLDYRLSKDSRFRNPLKEVFPAGYPLRKEEMGKFYKKRDEVLAWLANDVPLQRKVEEVTSDILQ